MLACRGRKILLPSLPPLNMARKPPLSNRQPQPQRFLANCPSPRKKETRQGKVVAVPNRHGLRPSNEPFELIMLPPPQPPEHTEIAILGAGFAGLCMAIRLKQQGHHNLTVFEKAGSLGGTWRDNSYPGCGCDVPSDLYSLSFEQNPD